MQQKQRQKYDDDGYIDATFKNKLIVDYNYQFNKAVMPLVKRGLVEAGDLTREQEQLVENYRRDWVSTVAFLRESRLLLNRTERIYYDLDSPTLPPSQQRKNQQRKKKKSQTSASAVETVVIGFLIIAFGLFIISSLIKLIHNNL
jgi:hypothetical protein